MARNPYGEIWTAPRPIVGMIHLRPLPGSPGWDGSMKTVLDRALEDLAALAGGGVDGVIVENFGDAPFYPQSTPAETIASMAVVAREIRNAARGIAVGINVLRNDAAGAVAVAAAADLAFVRVNIHTGALLTDQGWITGAAHETLRLRARIAPRVAIFADVLVKHAVAPADMDPGAAARDTWSRGLADALIVTGPATGRPPDPDRLLAVRQAVPEAPLWIGSGLTPENARALIDMADGAIVGSSLQHDGTAGAGVDRARVRAFIQAARPGGFSFAFGQPLD